MDHQSRTFAHSALACGSMVLYLYSVSFFAPLGQKTTHKRLNLTDKRKSYNCDSGFLTEDDRRMIIVLRPIRLRFSKAYMKRFTLCAPGTRSTAQKGTIDRRQSRLPRLPAASATPRSAPPRAAAG